MSSAGNPFQAFSFKGEKEHAASAPPTPLVVVTGALGAESSNPAVGSISSPPAASPAACKPQGKRPAAGRSRRQTEPPPAAAAAAAGSPAKRQRKQQRSALTGEPKGLQEKLGPGQPLRLILVGHNPSEHAWHVGHVYANPSNRFWPILISTGIAPPGTTGPEADDSMPTDVGVGFTDVGTGHPGTDSSNFSSHDFQVWRASFYSRLEAHLQAASSSIGCTCGQCGAPALVAFTGKRQFLELMNLDSAGQLLKGKAKVASSSVQLGLQPPDKLPPGWPLPASCEVWVLTSTSGAAPMSHADRERPYLQLAERLHGISWPRVIQLRCKGGAAAAAGGGCQGQG